MEISTSQVDLENISLDHKKLKFDPQSNQAEIETLAHSIVRLQGLLEIPIVKRTGVETCELLSGALEYCAYLEARKIDPSLPDRLRVFILDQQKIEPALEQIETVNELKIGDSGDRPSGDQSYTELKRQINNLSSQFSALESKLANLLADQIGQTKADILKEFNEHLPKPLPLLEAFNRISEPKSEAQVLKNLGDNARTRRLIAKAKQVISKRKQGFSSLRDLMDALGKDESLNKPTRFFTEGSLFKLLDRWD